MILTKVTEATAGARRPHQLLLSERPDSFERMTTAPADDTADTPNGHTDLGSVEARSHEPTWTVAEVMDRARDALHQTFPEEVWVSGEIRNLNRSQRGHVYFSLVDPGSDSSQSISLKVTLFDWYKKKVNHILTRAHGQIRMADGVQVRIRGKVDLYAARGELSFRMTSVDPNFTVGLLEIAKAAVLQRLSQEGLLSANRQVPLTSVPLRIALVTSAGSAAAADFLHELAESSFGFHVTLFDARVQGAESAASLVSAIERAGHSHADVLVVARGGGARTDLASFDEESVARAIAHSPLPVVTGIGHETDSSIADEVAHRPLKTPTAAAQFLIHAVRTAEQIMERHAEAVLVRSLQRLDTADRRLRSSAAVLDSLTRRNEASLGHRIDLAIERLNARAATVLSKGTIEAQAVRLKALVARFDRIERELDHRAATAELHHPRLLAARGYSLVRSVDGSLITSIAGVSPGFSLDVQVADGTIAATAVSTTASDAPMAASDHGRAANLPSSSRTK